MLVCLPARRGSLAYKLNLTHRLHTDLSVDLVYDQQVPQRVCPDGTYPEWVSLRLSSPKTHLAQVFDNYAVTVMIGEDPYTLGLFDTAGTCYSYLKRAGDHTHPTAQVRRITTVSALCRTPRQMCSSFALA